MPTSFGEDFNFLGGGPSSSIPGLPTSGIQPGLASGAPGGGGLFNASPFQDAPAAPTAAPSSRPQFNFEKNLPLAIGFALESGGAALRGLPAPRDPFQAMRDEKRKDEDRAFRKLQFGFNALKSIMDMTKNLDPESRTKALKLQFNSPTFKNIFPPGFGNLMEVLANSKLGVDRKDLETFAATRNGVKGMVIFNIKKGKETGFIPGGAVAGPGKSKLIMKTIIDKNGEEKVIWIKPPTKGEKPKIVGSLPTGNTGQKTPQRKEIFELDERLRKIDDNLDAEQKKPAPNIRRIKQLNRSKLRFENRLKKLTAVTGRTKQDVGAAAQAREAGKTGAQRKADLEKTLTNVAIMTRRASELIGLVEKGGAEILSATGLAVRFANVVSSQVKAIASLAGVSRDASVYDFSAFPEVAALSARVKSALIDLAILKAQAIGLGSGKALSDRDIQLQLNSIGASAGSPEQFKAVMTQAINGVIDDLQIRFQRNRHLFDKPTDVREELNKLGVKFGGGAGGGSGNGDVKKMSDEDLKRSLGIR